MKLLVPVTRESRICLGVAFFIGLQVGRALEKSAAGKAAGGTTASRMAGPAA